MNGRVRGANEGYAYIGNAGRSTIDYALVNAEAWNFVEDMTLHSRVDSDHLPLSVTLKLVVERAAYARAWAALVITTHAQCRATSGTTDMKRISFGNLQTCYIL